MILSLKPEIVLFVIHWKTYFYFGSLNDLNLNFILRIHTYNLFNIFNNRYLSLYFSLFDFSIKLNSTNLKCLKTHIQQNVCVILSLKPEIVLFVKNWKTYFYFVSLNDLNLNLYTPHSYLRLIQYLLQTLFIVIFHAIWHFDKI